MKTVLILSFLLSFVSTQAQVVPYIPTRINIMGSFMDIEVYNHTDTDLNCQGWVTLYNSQIGSYGQFFYSQLVWSRTSSLRSYYLGPYANSFWIHVVSNTIQCRLN